MLRAVGLLLACVTLCANAAEPATAPLPAELFSHEFDLDTVELSPDGQRLALVVQLEDKEHVGVLNVADGKRTLLTYSKASDPISALQWKSDRYLLYQAVVGDQPLLAVLDFKSQRHFPVNYKGQYTTFADMRWNDPERLLVKVGSYSLAEVKLRDTSPGFGYTRSHYVTERFSRFTIDPQGQVRIALTWEQDNTRRLLYRNDNKDDWGELLRFEEGGNEIWPAGFTDDGRQLYVLSNAGRDTVGLFLYDLTARKLSEPLFAPEDTDVTDPVYSNGLNHLVSVRSAADSQSVHFVDPRAEAMQLAARKAFPDLQTDLISFDAGMTRALVHAHGPMTPGSLSVYDKSTGTMKVLVDMTSGIKPEQMSPVQPFTVTASDGLPLRGYLVVPRNTNGKNLPLIVSVVGERGGARHHGSFDPTAQFLASRGYAVLQLNPRGSTGYGRRYREAAYKNWHTAVQSDLAEAIDSLVRAGIADRSRVGIYGQGFGGYVALLALTTHPDLFRTAIIYGGFADPQVMLGLRRIWVSSDIYYSVSRSEQQLAAILGTKREAGEEDRSPLKRLDRIRAPVFIAHGTADTQVPFAEAKKLAHALSGKPGAVSGFMPEGEGHTFRRESNRAELYRRVERFLNRTLAPRAPNAPVSAPEPLEIPATH